MDIGSVPTPLSRAAASVMLSAMADERRDFWAGVGRSLAAGGWTAARHVRDLIEHVDPDARRHLLQLPLLAYTLVASRDEPVDPGEPDGHPPLVFVHGLGGEPRRLPADDVVPEVPRPPPRLPHPLRGWPDD